ncbi:MAG: cell division protein FtsZ [Hyphomicrobiales bacterium]|nr:cell division protein FtsZ [Hyphomicrobiales bacterium]MDE2115913.1 cell division protein FtsZ [Hyphomicrobiales bacterium]
MTINLQAPELRELKPRIMVCGVGGAGGNAVNNMIESGLVGVDFIVANTDAQALTKSKAERIIQMGLQVTEGLGAGSKPEIGHAAAEEAMGEVRDHLAGAHMVFVTAGMGGGTGTGAAPVIARIARDMGILTVGVVTKPFQFEGQRRMRVAEAGIAELQKSVDTLIVIPNQNLFRVANEKTTFADAFAMADQVLYSGVACITDLMVKEGLINLDFADVRATMREMGKAMMGTGEATGDNRAILAAEAAIANPLLDEVSMKGARGLLISITGGNDLTLYEVDEAASRIRQEVDEDANIILGATFDASLDGIVRVSVVATGIDVAMPMQNDGGMHASIAEAAQRLRAQVAARASEPVLQVPAPAPLPAPQPVAAPVIEPVQVMAPAPVAEPVAEYTPVEVPAPAPQAHAVYVQPVAPRPVVNVAPQYQPAPQPEPQMRAPAANFIPPAPEQMTVRAQRLPSYEDLPLPGQAQLRAQRGEPAPAQAAESKRRSLLDRLANFGLGRNETAPAQQRVATPVQAPRQAISQGVDPRRPVVQNTPRAGQVPLDVHGRQAPSMPRISEEDDSEIPAFLRRQAL